MSDKRWYVADALQLDLIGHHYHLRAACEQEAERRMCLRYPEAVAVLVRLEESRRPKVAPSFRSGPVS